MQKKTRIIIAVAVCAALCISGTFAFTAIAAKKEPPPQNRREYKVSRTNITVGVEGAGIASVDKTTQKSVVDGKIDKILVKSGQNVEKGEPIATLNEEFLKEKLKDAQVALKKAGIALEQAQIAKRQADMGAEGTFNNLVDKISSTKSEYQSAVAKQNELIAALAAQADGITAEIAALKAKLDAAPDADKAAIQAQIDVKAKLHADTVKQHDAEKAKLDSIVKEYSAAEGAWQNDAKNAGENKDLAIKSSALSYSLAQMEYENLKKAESEIKKALQDLNIYADTSGIVLAIDAKEGGELAKGTPLITIGNMNGCTLQILVPQTEIFKVKEGQETELYFEAYPDTAIYGKVESISFIPENSNNAVNYKVIIRLPQTEQVIYEGMTAEATFIIKQKKDVLAISAKAITFENGKQYIIKKGADGKDVKTEIETGFSDGKTTEITKGAVDGDIAFAERKTQ
ncbi:MAG: HlyD family efflux transporter periplasmic adaptor subunit [Oscillospiraceae bacterium]